MFVAVRISGPTRSVDRTSVTNASTVGLSSTARKTGRMCVSLLRADASAGRRAVLKTGPFAISGPLILMMLLARGRSGRISVHG